VHKLKKKIENNNCSLNDGVVKKTVIFELKFLCFLVIKKTIQIVIKSLVNAVATFKYV